MYPLSLAVGGRRGYVDVSVGEGKGQLPHSLGAVYSRRMYCLHYAILCISKRDSAVVHS